MNAAEVLENGHLLVIQTLNNLPETEWDIPNASGSWSVKDIVSHLTSYEHLLIDVLNTLLQKEDTPPTPYLSRFIKGMDAFNDTEVQKRANAPALQVLDEYEEAYAEAGTLLALLPAETLQQAGTMLWFGAERSLNDLINVEYEHTRKHCEAITAFRNREKQ